MNLADHFARVYVLNLPDRTDRRRAMAAELERAGMPFAAGRVELVPGVRPAQAAGFPDRGVHGCFLAHLAALKRARDEAAGDVLVLEDDLAIAPDLQAHAPRFVERLRSAPWDIVYFGHPLELPAPPGGPALVPAPRTFEMLHFAGYSRRVLPRLVEFLEQVLARPPGHPDGGPMHVDGAVSTFWSRHADVIALVAAPSQGWQRSSRSDIRPAKWFERLPVVRNLAEGGRALKRRLDPRGRR